MGEAVENERLTASGGNSFFCVWLPTDLILGNMSTARCFWVACKCGGECARYFGLTIDAPRTTSLQNVNVNEAHLFLGSAVS
jgi:hypothetical protein